MTANPISTSPVDLAPLIRLLNRTSPVFNVACNATCVECLAPPGDCEHYDATLAAQAPHRWKNQFHLMTSELVTAVETSDPMEPVMQIISSNHHSHIAPDAAMLATHQRRCVEHEERWLEKPDASTATEAML